MLCWYGGNPLSLCNGRSANDRIVANGYPFDASGDNTLILKRKLAMFRMTSNGLVKQDCWLSAVWLC